nr:uncharacterized protein LOC131783583 [Pocillopora verrucosa]
MKMLQDELERLRLQALRDAEEITRIEDEEQRENLDVQRREAERLARELKEEEKMLKLKETLMNYDFQCRPLIRKEAFLDLQVDDIELIRIALIGPAGSGKTSFIGTLQRAIGETQSAFEHGLGGEGTILLHEYYVQKYIRMLDTRGFFAQDEKLVDECLDILTGRIRPGEEIEREHEKSENRSSDGGQDPMKTTKKTSPLSKCVHAVIFVVKGNDRRLEKGIYTEPLRKIRAHFQRNGHAPVTVITCLDKLKTEEDQRDACYLAARVTGGPGERTHLISNYTKENNCRSLAVERSALDILESALISAESFIRVHKQKEKNQIEREIMASEPKSGADSVERFFARLMQKHHWTEQGKVNSVLDHLRRQEINTVMVLKEMWEEVKSDLPLSMGMKKVLEQEMGRI